MLSREKILDYLEQIGEALAAYNLHGEILLTGGAVMCLVHSARDSTKDIDALYEPKDIINRIAGNIAERENLPIGWLNDGAKAFVGQNAPMEEFITFKGLSIQTVSAEYLLAMKWESNTAGDRG